jgi:hypothetical protein
VSPGRDRADPGLDLEWFTTAMQSQQVLDAVMAD